MPYPTDTLLTPTELMYGLINFDNGLGLVDGDLAFTALTAEANPDTVAYPEHDTSIVAELLTNEVVGDTAKFHYKRIDLSELVPFVLPANDSKMLLGEVDWENTTIAEVNRRLGINLSDGFGLAKAAGTVGFTTVTVAADAANMAYIGQFEISVKGTLAGRIPTTTLDGFSKDFTRSEAA